MGGQMTTAEKNSSRAEREKIDLEVNFGFCHRNGVWLDLRESLRYIWKQKSLLKSLMDLLFRSFFARFLRRRSTERNCYELRHHRHKRERGRTKDLGIHSHPIEESWNALKPFQMTNLVATAKKFRSSSANPLMNSKFGLARLDSEKSIDWISTQITPCCLLERPKFEKSPLFKVKPLLSF